MCIQWNYFYIAEGCGRRSSARFDNCPSFGRGCSGAGGNHGDIPVEDICADCKNRALDPNPNPNPDPYQASKDKAKRNKPKGRKY
ncbi:hypothetical protein B0T21DRAFT_299358 [Apiosordaria backusii]|uniref:Uncharacterized protein n=1 Tax=Apiosordaria backusii TaxID=314023 RepID=A0AA39ZV71_9PEZI|nr:hypothetical protein B0T21DRAFT_299358 [Apiosordaria backusii]